MITDNKYSFTHQSMNASLNAVIAGTANRQDMEKIYSFANNIRIKNAFKIDYAIFEDNITKGLVRFVEAYNSSLNDSPVILWRTIIFNDLVNFSGTNKMKERLSHYKISEVEEFFSNNDTTEFNIEDTNEKTSFTLDEELLLQQTIKDLNYQILYDWFYNGLSYDDLMLKYNKNKYAIGNRIHKEKELIKNYFNNKTKWNRKNNDIRNKSPYKDPK
jgi:hypothetical protein